MNSPILRSLRPVLASFALALCAHTASAVEDAGLFLYSWSNSSNNLTLDNTTVLSSGFNQGWWSNSDLNDAANANYGVGFGNGADHRNFFVFDISDLTGPVNSAVLNLQFFQAVAPIGVTSLTYALFDVATDPVVLLTRQSPDLAVFNDLGSGLNYGVFSVALNHAETDIISLQLNSAGLAQLNAAIAGDARYFAIGGALQSSSVPEASSTFVLFGLAVAGAAVLRRKQAC